MNEFWADHVAGPPPGRHHPRAQPGGRSGTPRRDGRCRSSIPGPARPGWAAACRCGREASRRPRKGVNAFRPGPAAHRRDGNFAAALRILWAERSLLPCPAFSRFGRGEPGGTGTEPRAFPRERLRARPPAAPRWAGVPGAADVPVQSMNDTGCPDGAEITPGEPDRVRTRGGMSSMSCVLLCCTPSSHALVLAAQAAAAPAEAPSPRARDSRARQSGPRVRSRAVPRPGTAPLLARRAPTRCAAGALACLKGPADHDRTDPRPHPSHRPRAC